MTRRIGLALLASLLRLCSEVRMNAEEKEVDLPKLPSEDDWEQVTLDNLRAWDWAAENPALLRQQKLDIALTLA